MLATMVVTSETQTGLPVPRLRLRAAWHPQLCESPLTLPGPTISSERSDFLLLQLQARLPDMVLKSKGFWWEGERLKAGGGPGLLPGPTFWGSA